MEMPENATRHDAYVKVMVKELAVIPTASGGREIIKPDVGAVMPLRQALDLRERAPKKAGFDIAGEVSPLEPEAGYIAAFVPGATLENDPIRERDATGFPLHDGLEYAPGTV